MLLSLLLRQTSRGVAEESRVSDWEAASLYKYTAIYACTCKSAVAGEGRAWWKPTPNRLWAAQDWKQAVSRRNWAKEQEPVRDEDNNKLVFGWEDILTASPYFWAVFSS